ncbi:MAG: helix-turn-helix transcriptional regulator [Clostridia bacterium]|nr:helix-turn-helix transcriptional regulator [Clostridia bacterium]
MSQYLDKRDTDYVRDNLVFNYCLGDDQELLIESYIHNNQLAIHFDPRHFYFFMTGPHKKFVKPYTPESFHEGIDRVFQTYDAMRDCLRRHGYDGNVFLIKEDNSKQTGILFSPSQHPSASPEAVAQALYDTYTGLRPHVPYISTSFVGPYSGYEQIHQAFLDARELNDLYFFGVRNTVITRAFKDQTARPCDITAILSNVRRLTNTLCLSEEKEALRQADYLIDSMIAPSYSHLNFAALWAASEDVIGMFEKVYPDHVRIEHRPLESFYTLDTYKAWLHEAIQTLYRQLSGVPRHSPTILMALSFINQNFATDLSLTQLSEYVYVNPSTLSSEFNAEVGMSLSEYVTALRIRRAQQLLREGEAAIPDIAQQAGFSSAKYFREIFKRQTGLSPQQYRNEHHKTHPA